jgi:hypothetical protein
MLVQLGLGPGKQVVVVCDPANEELLVLNEETCDQDCPDAVYTVESDGKVRITQAALERAGLGGLQSYRIEGSDGVITVRRS